jgi:LysW-gamma-L-lysine carboxypeptidase
MDTAIQLLVDTLKMYSPSEKESKLAQFLFQKMKNVLGFTKVRLDSAGNVIGEVGNGDVHILLCGHMDTVPGRLRVDIRDEKIYGRGAVDAKSAMCAILMAAAKLQSRRLRFTVACATREEGDSLGINTLINNGGDYDYAILGEPAGASRVTIGYRGRVATNIKVETKGGHAASPWARPSAVDTAMIIFAGIKKYEREHTIQDNHFRSLSACLTIIKGGVYSNVIPSTCTMTIDVRVPMGMSCSDIQNDLKRIVMAHQKEDGATKIRINFEEPTEPYESNPDSLIVRAFQRSIIKNLGAKPTLIRKTGTGDMNTVAHRLKIPCVTYGPGNSRLAHTNEEFVEIEDYLNSIKILKGVFHELEVLSSSQ